MILVKLHSAGDYWQAAWTDARGKRCARSLGAKATLARPAAETRCMEIMLEVNRPEKRKGGKSSGVWTYVSDEMTARLLDACPNGAWRAMIGLCRWAGLRAGEARRLRWGSVDWGRRLIHVIPTTAQETTKQRYRTVPIQPQLYALLLREFDRGGYGPCNGVGQNTARDAGTIILRAGLTPYEKPLHNLRKSLESEWLALYPVLDVVSWLGNSPAVARAHYHQTLQSTIARVTEPSPYQVSPLLSASTIAAAASGAGDGVPAMKLAQPLDNSTL